MKQMNMQVYLEQKHPKLYTLYSLASRVWRFVFGGYIILALSRWLITTCGRIAESALLFCTLWITSQSVAPELFIGLGADRIKTATSVTLLLLALLPEVVLFSAIVATMARVKATLQRRTLENIVWSALFLLPTIAFFLMTGYTLITLASADHIVPQAHWAVVTRCLSAWSYALIGIVHVNWKHGTDAVQSIESEHAKEELLLQPVSDIEKILQSVIAMNQQNLQTIAEMNKQALNETVQRFQQVTIELVRETVDRSMATIVLPESTVKVSQIAEHTESPTARTESVTATPIETTENVLQPDEMEVLNLDQKPLKVSKNTVSFGPAIEAILKAHPEMEAKDVAEKVGCSERTVYNWMQKLQPALATSGQ